METMIGRRRDEEVTLLLSAWRGVGCSSRLHSASYKMSADNRIVLILFD